ncbi:MAG: hypothetical protein A3B23_02065 [Candidatus Colwellbacteria bacterium RIFCSPLOWO2_01_FULL_48_10]|uniref:Uncharacterized protein n=2 Tax=Bacteria candidate phyla TaxID=1783234 RepID=A0A1F5P1K6_9BACT|nr:MAG: hypothetical protein A2846_04445 [Candidatus Doudnabacteria bacterium RIFCSPHIGHO2_01_FULL_49_9]OGY59122.1 MAG: hypothetical protein A3B23_02065 [Candidatus Colwellbacteria bacterium RIFCSPLOWO2_01_FULL_48_10]
MTDNFCSFQSSKPTKEKKITMAKQPASSKFKLNGGADRTIVGLFLEIRLQAQGGMYGYQASALIKQLRRMVDGKFHGGKHADRPADHQADDPT